MISKKMAGAINGQINKEMYSAYLYMAMSAKANEDGLKGAANWFMVQYHEEMVHAMKFYEYLADQGASIALGAIAEPPRSFSSLLDMFEKTLTHEQFVTKSINDLMELAIAEKDHASQALLAWYVTEQVEEEKNDTEIIQTLRMIGDNKAALFMYDKELGARLATVPLDFSKGVSAAMGAA
ncbi:MAG: ferritin [Chitinispirillaceae bacterium]|nr:ferritin [Chitinispirillaceae bacterium]